MSHAILAVGRLTYAASAGIALVVVSLNPALTAAVGSYTLQAGIAGGLAALLPLGFDRTIARRRATETTTDFPVQLVLLRGAEVVVVWSAAVGVGWAWDVWGLALAFAAFATSRLLYADLETFWIASGRSDRLLGVVIGTNGLVTAAGILVGAPFGGSTMLLLSALGNFLAFMVLALVGRWKLDRGTLRPYTREAAGFGGSAALAVLYARADLLILAITGVSLDAVAIYGIITRLFDALGLVRGSIAQVEMRRLAPLSQSERFASMLRMARRTAYTSVLLGVGCLGLGLAVIQLPVFETWRPYAATLAISAVVVPAYLSHLPTVALVLADARSHLLFVGSAVSTAIAVAVKVVLIISYGVEGAVLSIGLVEVVSYLVFATLYRGDATRLRVLTSSTIALTAVSVGLVIVVATS